MAVPQATTLHVGDQAPDFHCRLCNGEQLWLSELWSQQKLLLAFTRHLGCTFCREQLCLLKSNYELLQQAGIEVLGVTMRSAEETLPLSQQLQLPFRCVCDPTLELYEAYRTRKGSYWNILGPSIWGKAIRTLARHGMGMPRGDITQLHATVLLDRGGTVLLTHYPATSAEQIACPSILDAAAGADTGSS